MKIWFLFSSKLRLDLYQIVFIYLAYFVYLVYFTNLVFITLQLEAMLPNHKGTKIIERKGWSHFDFAYSASAGELVFKSIIENINNTHKNELPNNLSTCQMNDQITPLNVKP